ncbi:hypothetical protein NST89_04215 [Caldifermentibacillus hisashii]|uniref:IS4 family transposase n=1 Tax=Caldifermentibacillus hisashii TaxID=996558 RepID=UPI003135BBAA
MITNKDYFAQLPKEIKQGFSELNIGYHLRKANITKLAGYSSLSVFKLIFLLVFQYKNWFRAFMSKRSQDLPGIEKITNKGLFVIGMVKQLKQRYVYNGERFTLNQLYKLAKPHMGKKDILGSVYATLDNGIPVKILFVRNRNKRSEWLAILSTDTTLENEEIIRIYGMRWDIEVFFKCNKSLLNLEKEFQGRSYDMLISHTTIVFTRYILIAWQMRKEEDPKTIGNLFYILCEDVKDIDFITALQSLIDLFQTLAEAEVSLNMDIFKNQMNKWLATIPNYIKQCLNISVCES